MEVEETHSSLVLLLGQAMPIALKSYIVLCNFEKQECGCRRKMVETKLVASRDVSHLKVSSSIVSEDHIGRSCTDVLIPYFLSVVERGIA
eukprot:scaffold843_cov330-Pavlova_lutheri.AAC.17